MQPVFTALETQDVRRLQEGGTDSYGLVPEAFSSDGDGVPCRHCLRHVEAGDDYLVLAFRPFPTVQAYAETGPIFLHCQKCERTESGHELPEILSSENYILRGYDERHRIVYGTGRVTPLGEMTRYAAELLARDEIAYIHVRSARNNCYQCRIERG
ncbi:DUF1203 domain-containing protein [Mesorhizobium sp. RP14(2022)]|uniref:DUF1203 domain-containing protein n=1 Tax=Mesorhizobium liriopis TaxID=2953882 RepID=A0ABT1C2L9_9HYPH|nr:DUF1203 domain-containing protein [Mesorhizobium liriopis]MCO6048728.1 DUF1203 domain-containing protein [Mesorhizobium liriopis]